MRNLRAFCNSLFIIAITALWVTLAVLLWPLSPRGGLFLLFARLWSKTLFYVCGVRWRAQVSPALDRGARYVYISNHESLTDILALFAAIPQPVVMVAKRSLFIVPIFSWGMWLAGFVFINRRDRGGAYRSIEKAGARVRKGRSVVVFPEGTRAEGDELLKFKRGGFVLARSAGVPIVPVGIYGTRNILPKHRFNVHPGDIAICVGAPIAAPPGEDLGPWIADVRAEVDRLRGEARALVEGTAPAPSAPQPAVIDGELTDHAAA